MVRDQLSFTRPTVGQAVIYALLLHFRVLLNFFYGLPKQDDCCVGHFRVFPEFAAAFPLELVDPPPDKARALSFNLNKRIAHLTATRWREHAPTMDFYSKYFEKMEQLLKAFHAALPLRIRQAYTEALREWENRHPAKV